MIDQETIQKIEAKLSKLEKLSNKSSIILASLFVVFVIWLLTPLIMIRFLQGMDLPENAGTIGDLFGSVNALFAGCAFALLIWSTIQNRSSIKIQQEELALQRKEMKENRDVLKDQADSQERMISSIDRLSHHNLLASQIEVLTSEIKLQNDRIFSGTITEIAIKARVKKKEAAQEKLNHIFNQLEELEKGFVSPPATHTP